MRLSIAAEILKHVTSHMFVAGGGIFATGK